MIEAEIKVTYGSFAPPQTMLDDIGNIKEKAHTHENQNILNQIGENTLENIGNNTSSRHSHGNKNVIDLLSADDVNNISANTAARHTHSNSDTLNKLGESGGSLTYDGKPIGERATESVEFLTGYEDYYVSGFNTNKVVEIFIYGLDKIPNNAEIKTIEINLNDQNYPGYIDYKELELKINIKQPCFAKFGKAIHNEENNQTIIAMMYFPYGGTVCDSLINGECSLRITYYKE